MACAAVQYLGRHRPQLRPQTRRPQTRYPEPPDPSDPNRVLLSERATYEPLGSHSHATHKPLTSHSLPLLSHPSLFPDTGHGPATHLSIHSLFVDSARWRHRVKFHQRATSNGASRMCRKTAAESSLSRVTLLPHQRLHWCTRSVFSLTSTFR